MFPKIILTTGCSYGKFAQSFKYWNNNETERNKFDGLELVIDLHSNSTGAKFQTLSIIETVEKLISNDINPKDIFVLGEFSEIIRKDILITDQTLVNIIDNFTVYDGENKQIKRTTGLFPEIVDFRNSQFTNFVVDFLQIKKFYASTFPKLNNYYLINLEHISPDIPSRTISDLIKFHSANPVHPQFFTIDRGIDYFENILTVQQYLKSKDVNYKFCLMNNQFSLFDNGPVYRNVLQTKVLDGEHYLYQDYLNSKQIWEVNSTIKILYDMIDWNKWWFYENKDKNIMWGGIDEYAIDNFGIEVFPSRNTDANLFGQHPNTPVYDSLIRNELMKEYF